MASRWMTGTMPCALGWRLRGVRGLQHWPLFGTASFGRVPCIPQHSVSRDRPWRQDGTLVKLLQLPAKRARLQTVGSAPLGSGLGDSVPPKDFMPALFRFFGLTLLVVVGTFMSHPMLLQMTVFTWDLTPSNGVNNFDTSFFGLISIIYGLLVSNSFLFLYERQTLLVQELFHEVFAIELLLQQSLLLITDYDLRLSMVKGIRQYVAEEIYQPTDMASPFSPDSSFMQLVGLMAQVKQAGAGDPTVGLVQALEKLADAQSRRSAVAVQLLPKIHWLFLHLVEGIFIITLLAFQAAHIDMVDDVSHERQLAFAALCGFLTLTSQMLYDIAEPVNGLYGFRDSLDQRLQYVDRLLASMLQHREDSTQQELDGEKSMQEGLSDLLDLGMMANMSAMVPPQLRRKLALPRATTSSKLALPRATTSSQPVPTQPEQNMGSMYSLSTWDSDSDASDSDDDSGGPMWSQETTEDFVVGGSSSSSGSSGAAYISRSHHRRTRNRSIPVHAKMVPKAAGSGSNRGGGVGG